MINRKIESEKESDYSKKKKKKWEKREKISKG